MIKKELRRGGVGWPSGSLSRRTFLHRVALGAGGGLLAAGLSSGVWLAAAGKTTSRARSPKPNIILLTADSLRADHVGAYGYPRATTPNLDRLAAEGVRFEYAFAP
ncbi:MAG: sulfatase-like hydrolase/transferase, partial [candidate division NC10 bacterium]|nr:sulfatase-like hydrolase/transferase [candidate division NC10 bacterium]